MKIVVIGGSGLIGRKLVKKLDQRGHQALAASPSTGINAITGDGLAAAFAGAQVVVDVANAPSWEDQAVLDFFTTSTRNMLEAEAEAGVGHHVALSVVGAERLPESGYFRAKMAQENLIAGSGIPYTIVRATQFFEFVDAIAAFSTRGDTVRLAPALFQPIAADDVAEALMEVALTPPVNGMIEVAGPEAMPLDEAVRKYLLAGKVERKVVADVQAGYFGTAVNDESLTPGSNPRIAATRFDDWLRQSMMAQSAAAAAKS